MFYILYFIFHNSYFMVFILCFIFHVLYSCLRAERAHFHSGDCCGNTLCCTFVIFSIRAHPCLNSSYLEVVNISLIPGHGKYTNRFSNGCVGLWSLTNPYQPVNVGIWENIYEVDFTKCSPICFLGYWTLSWSCLDIYEIPVLYSLLSK